MPQGSNDIKARAQGYPNIGTAKNTSKARGRLVWAPSIRAETITYRSKGRLHWGGTYLSNENVFDRRALRRASSDSSCIDIESAWLLDRHWR